MREKGPANGSDRSGGVLSEPIESAPVKFGTKRPQVQILSRPSRTGPGAGQGRGRGSRESAADVDGAGALVGAGRTVRVVGDDGCAHRVEASAFGRGEHDRCGAQVVGELSPRTWCTAWPRC